MKNPGQCTGIFYTFPSGQILSVYALIISW